MARERFFALLREALDAKAFRRLVLSRPVGAASDRVRVSVRELALRSARELSLVSSHTTRDVTKNLPIDAGVAEIDALVGGVFADAHLDSTSGQVQLRMSRKGRYALSRARSAPPPSGSSPSASSVPFDTPAAAPAHDRVKRRYVDIARPWLVDLGVTDEAGRLIPSMARKWKQINRFVEVFDHAYAASALTGRRQIRVDDFGSGKGYLTFAIHDHLRHALGVEAEVIGVELRADLVDLCNRAAGRSALDGLRFVQGDVRSAAPQALDVMIALHACDTATDHALHAGVRAGAAIIMSAPCCHKQLRPQMRSPALLAPMLQHGIHLGQQAEMVTDSLRALLLEREGYATQVFEFVALEHTHKNKMILAVRRDRSAVDRAAVQGQIREIKSFYGIDAHCLETLLVADAATG